MTDTSSTVSRRLFLAGCAAGSVSALSGCSTPAIDAYRGQQPALDLAEYFRGALTAQGMFVDRFGAVRRRFAVKMQAEWQGSEGTLAEDFVYDDGERSRRVWQVSTVAPGRWRGRAGDVVGEAIGEGAGSAVRWQYRLELPIQGRVWVLDVDDWMHRIDERHVLNRARFSKFGIDVGEVQIAFQRP